MAYNNGGNYNTNYGAQGGADGGGFVQNGYGGSQGGSQSEGKTYGKDTLRPVTIKQIIDAEQPHPDGEFLIDGAEVSTLTFVGQIVAVSSQATNTTYKLDDGTGIIEVKQWVDGDADQDNVKPLHKEDTYLRAFGRLKQFNGKRHVGAHVVRPIEDHNEVSMHLLEATYVHLFFTRGPLDPGATGVKTENSNNGGMFVDNNGNAGSGAKQLPARVSNVGRKVWELLSKAENNEGLHTSLIAQRTGLSPADVFKAGDELLAEGCIFTTIDDETWAVLEY